MSLSLSLPLALLQPAWLLSYDSLDSDDVPLLLEEPQGSYKTSASGEPARPFLRRTDHDGHWKDALQAWLRPCIALLWPELDALVDWTVAPVFMDKELRRVGGSLYRDRRYTDLLAALHTTHNPVLLLLHIEVQRHMDREFARRMYHYYTRLQARYPNHDILQFAIITQGRNFRKIRRIEYCQAPLTGNFLRLDYSTPVIHLQDWAGQEDKLAVMAASNPFALILLAELRNAATRNQAAQRLQYKTALVRELYRHHYSATEIRQLFLFIDATIRLNREHLSDFSQELESIEKEQKMAYMSSVERYLREELAKERRTNKDVHKKSRTEGVRQTLNTLLEQRFGPLPDYAQQRLQNATLPDLANWTTRILTAASLNAVLAG